MKKKRQKWGEETEEHQKSKIEAYFIAYIPHFKWDSFAVLDIASASELTKSVQRYWIANQIYVYRDETEYKNYFTEYHSRSIRVIMFSRFSLCSKAARNGWSKNLILLDFCILFYWHEN